VPSIAWLVPGSIHARTGGSIYDKRMIDGLRARGWTVDVSELTAPGDAAAVLPAVADGTTVVVDGLVFGRIPDTVRRHARRLRFVPVVHLPLGEEPGLSADRARELDASERKALTHAARVVVTGAATLKTIVDYGVRPDRVAVVEPGTDPAPLAQGSGESAPHFLCVATFNAGKGHEMLVRAFAANASRPWHLTCVGNTDRHPEIVECVRAAVRANGLDARVDVTGELGGEALEARYARADAFVLATLHETYGMAVAEALARGLPVIATKTGAIPSLVGEEAGLLVAPGDADALAAALSRFLDDSGLRATSRAAAARVRTGLRTWTTAVDEMITALDD
jgi:glycosyltransferase involved in cell wall biosynthesis